MTDNQSFEFKHTGLSEDEVKRKFVPFLKDFYKNRYEPLPNTVEVELDNVSADGLVADGKITFRKSDGSLFVCTYEATSRDKAEEVKYTLNAHYFIWDCVAFGAVCAAAAYVFFYVARLQWLLDLKAVGNIGLLLGMGLIGFLGWYFTMQRWRKYRFIHAIAQFKRYFADEQWVALADDVFPAPNDPYLLELRNQCIYNGIGLALVPAEGMVRKLNDPSRLGIYGKDRQMAHWVTRAQWYQAMSQSVGTVARYRPPDQFQVLWNKITRPVHYLVIDPFKRHIGAALNRPFGQSTSTYTRFMDAQTVQKLIAALAFLVIVPMFWKVASFQEENVADLDKLQKWKGGKNPEDQYGYVIDGEAIPYDDDVRPSGIPKQYPVAKGKKQPEIQTLDLSGDDEAEDTQTINLSGDDDEAEKPKPNPKVQAAKQPATDPCELLRTRSGWIIQDNAFSSKNLAAARVAELNKQGIPCAAAAQSCIADGRTGYLVWLGSIQNSEANAEKAATNFEKALQRYGLSKGKPLVRKLR
jgi:hypothetical protein